MPSLSERRRNNVRAGIFVSVTIIVAVAVIVVLSGVWAKLSVDSAPYAVLYEVSAGVKNLQPGGEVRIGGVGMGQVNGVTPELVEGQPFERIRVDFEVDRAVTLYADARIFVTSPILGTDPWLDIISVGTPDAGPSPEGVIIGAEAGGLLGSLVGTENAAATERILGNTEAFTTFLAGMPAEFDERVVPILDDARVTSGNLSATSSDIRAFVTRVREEDWQRWSSRVDEISEWAVGVTATLDQMMEEGRLLIADSRAVVAENRDPLRNTLANAEDASVDLKAIMARVEEETVEKANRFLDTGNEALTEARSALEKLRRDYDGWAVDIGEAMGNATLASQQLKLTLVEVRRSPWKLLYRPSAAELSHELLYDAARSFALATADLKAASASVEAILERHPDRLDDDPALRERLKRSLLDPLQNYELAQERLLDVLFTEE